MKKTRSTLTRYWTLFPIYYCTILLPREVNFFLSRLIATTISLFLPARRKALQSNFHVIGHRAKSRDTFVNFGNMLVDYMSMPRLSTVGIGRMISRIEGAGRLDEALSRGNGVILVTPHLGNWELGGLYLASKGYSLSVLTYPDDDPKTESFRRAIRKKYNIENIYVRDDGNGAEMVLNILAALRGGKIVCMLTDRKDTRFNISVPLFGTPVDLPGGPALISFKTGAPILPVYCVLERNGAYRLIADNPIYPDQDEKREEALRSITMEMASSFERYISRYPDQWYNFFTYWE